MDMADILGQVPAYTEFLTVKELEESSQELAEAFPEVTLFESGQSQAGRAISCLKLGNGPRNALLFAFPHPNEPIGSLTIEFLARFLAENPKVMEELGYTWYLIKTIDPDGAVLNEGWFKGPFDPIKYAKNFYRPPSHEQIEWTFPVKYKKLVFSNPPPETQALMRLIEKIKPSFMYSLHNAEFCGVYFYVSHDIQAMFPPLLRLVAQENLPPHQGEPEAPFITTLHPAIFRMGGVQDLYDFYVENGVENPQDLIPSGTSSNEYLRTTTAGHGFTLVCEMPYFSDPSLNDNSSSEYDRRDVVLNALDFQQTSYQFMKPYFERIRPYCDPASRIFRSVLDYIENFEKRLPPRLHHAQTSATYEGKATVAQAFDSNVANRYYYLLQSAMTARLCSEAMVKHPERQDELETIRNEIDHWITTQINELLGQSNFEVIPIQKLVRVQVGSALIALTHLPAPH